MLRMVDALNFHEKHGEVCPMNWKEGDEAISATKESTAAYLAKQ
jgi:peroxiredoxin (alkyl hydroperoxide reductase subunit C)